MTQVYNPIDIARQYRFVRESTQNHGQRVEAIQRWCGGVPGDSWCAYFVTMVLDIAHQGNSPIPREGVVQNIYDLAKRERWLTTFAEIGDLFVYIDSNKHAHHIGFVTSTNPLIGIAGNTSEDGKSSNGTGVYEHEINAPVFITYPR